MDQVMEQKSNKPNFPPFEKGISPKEEPDTGPKKDQQFPDSPEQGESKPIPDMDAPEQGDK